MLSDTQVVSTYFEKPGKENTQRTFELAKRRAEALGIRTILVASTRGETGVRACEVFQGYDVVVVTHSTGFKEPNYQELTDENRAAIEAAGGKILTCQHTFGGVGRAVRKKQHSQDTDGHFFAVVVGVGPLELRESIVDGMGRRQPTTFESHAAEQRVRFDHVRKCRGHEVLFARYPSGQAVFQDRIVAEACQVVRGECPEPTTLVRRIASLARVGFEPRRQGIAHTRHEKADRRFRDHAGVYQHEVRIARQEEIPLESSFPGVDHGYRARRSVRRSNRRHDRHTSRSGVAHGLGRVNHLAAAHADDCVASSGLRSLGESFDLFVRALTPKGLDGRRESFLPHG